MPLNKDCPIKTILLGITWSFLAAFGVPKAVHSQTSEVSEEQSDSSSRIRVSGTVYRFLLDGKVFSATGPDFAFDSAVGSRWAASGSFGQAFSMGSGFGTLFTALDISLWYSLWGSFIQERRIWRDQGNVISQYVGKRTGGFRIGLGTQQYFFNVSSGAIPFSGMSAKLLYEFGLNTFFDVAVGVESSRLANAVDKASSTRMSIAVIMPLKL